MLFGYQFLSPNVLYEPSPIVNAGQARTLSCRFRDAGPAKRHLRRPQPEGFYALSAICTHLGCLTAWKPELGIIACPCHGSSSNRMA